MTGLATLWDFDDPEGSLARFTAAAGRADEPERSVLLTQAARAHGLAGRCTSGHRILDSIDADALGLVATPDQVAEVRARTALERGRLHRSGSTPGARECFDEAATLTATGSADPLAALHLDALHMLALLPDDPAEQVAATERALAAARAGSTPGARRWVAVLLNNLGMAQYEAGDDEAALASFEEGLAVRVALGDRRGAQVSRWTVGWALRLLGRTGEALAVQEALAAELAADGIDDRYVAEELAQLCGDRTGPATR